jgi:hypothetical protein
VTRLAIRIGVALGALGAFVLGGAAGCSFPEPSAEYACRTTSDCDSGRVCESGFCVVSSNAVVDAPGGVDAPPLPADADPAAVLAAQCLAKGYALASGPNGSLGYYRLGVGNKQWLDAQADCAADVPGASHLIVLSTVDEVTYLRGLALPRWIGLSDRTTEGTFTTVTGETGDQRPFASGQPDNGSGSEDCVQMRSGGQLDDDQCDNTHPFVCECDGRPSSIM